MSLRDRALACFISLVAVLIFGSAPLSAQETAQAPAAPAAEEERGGIETIVVTARKKEESVQDIPIAVSAFSADDLSASNIDDVADVQFNVPNLKFTKTNFSGAGNISLRGVGNLAVAATSEAGTGISVNTAPFPGARVFETEFYDVDRVEVLRGPQGTLFGRSAPGGTLNVYTKKPVLEEWGGYLQPEYGYYNHGKLRAAMNVPMGEHFAGRLAGYYFHRDGTTHNVSTGNRVDGREVYALRGSLYGEWDQVNFNLMAQWFEKDDDSMRINKQGCTTDPNPWPYSIGCLGGDNELKRGSINYNSTLAYSAGIITDTFHILTAGAPAAFQVPRFLSGPLAAFTPYLGALGFGPGQTTNYVFTDAEGQAFFGTPATTFGAPSYGLPTPYYNGSNVPRSSRLVATQFDPEYTADEFEITLEVNWDIMENVTLTSVTGWHEANVNSMTDYWWSDAAVPFDGGPRSFDFPESDLGGFYESEFVFDRSHQNDKFFTQELRATTAFDGRFNATVGAIYNDGEVDAEYFVWAASLEAVWDMPGDPLGFCPAAAAITSLGGSCHDAHPTGSRYLNETKPTTLQSYAVFGELYVDLLETTRLTVGARYTDDKKTDTQRVNLWTCDPAGASATEPCGDIPFERREGGWTKVTWKVSLDHHFDLPFAPESLVYGIVSTGYKGGGFNPAVDTSQSGGATTVPDEFAEEEITAYEIGYKGTLFEQMTFNLSGFFYDYKGMQISKIVSRTAVNENVDTHIYGIEAETFWQATERARIDLNVAWLKTEIQKGQSADAADPTAGVAGWFPIKQLLPFPAGQNAICNPSINPTGVLCLDPTPTANDAADGYLIDGFIKDLKGNELPASPEWSIKLGAQYTLPFFGGWEATPRVDFYWQAETWGRFYNTEKDRIDTWQQVDASMIFSKEGSPFLVELWSKNLQDNDDITGHYFTDATSANFTNLFILEPRTYGISVRYTWGESEI